MKKAVLLDEDLNVKCVSSFKSYSQTAVIEINNKLLFPMIDDDGINYNLALVDDNLNLITKIKTLN